jgi:hypothetical protein
MPREKNVQQGVDKKLWRSTTDATQNICETRGTNFLPNERRNQIQVELTLS